MQPRLSSCKIRFCRTSKRNIFSLSFNHCKMEDHTYCRYTGGLSWQKSCSRISLNAIDARIDTMLTEAVNLTKLKRVASTLEDRLRNENDLDKLKLHFEKIWCYSTGTSAQYSSESEKLRHQGWSKRHGNSPVKGLGVQDAFTLIFQFRTDVETDHHFAGFVLHHRELLEHRKLDSFSQKLRQKTCCKHTSVHCSCQWTLRLQY